MQIGLLVGSYPCLKPKQPTCEFKIWLKLNFRSTLQKHISVIHDKERPYRCEVCPSSAFGQKVIVTKSGSYILPSVFSSPHSACCTSFYFMTALLLAAARIEIYQTSSTTVVPLPFRKKLLKSYLPQKNYTLTFTRSLSIWEELTSVTLRQLIMPEDLTSSQTLRLIILLHIFLTEWSWLSGSKSGIPSMPTRQDTCSFLIVLNKWMMCHVEASNVERWAKI